MTLTRDENEKLARLLGWENGGGATPNHWTTPDGRWIRTPNWSRWAAYDIADPRELLDTEQKRLDFYYHLDRADSFLLKATPSDIARAVLEAVDGSE